MSVNSNRWGTAFRALGEAILFFLWSALMVFLASLPALGVLYLLGVPTQFYITAFVGYVGFNFSVTLKNLSKVKEIIRDPKVSRKALVLVSVLVANVLLVVYPVIGWFLTRWMGEAAVWVPFFLLWWEISVISGENRVLHRFTVTWVLAMFINLIMRVFHVSPKRVEVRTAGSPLMVVMALFAPALRR